MARRVAFWAGVPPGPVSSISSGIYRPGPQQPAGEAGPETPRGLRRLRVAVLALAVLPFAASGLAADVPTQLADINPGAASSAPGESIDVDGTVYFAAEDAEHGRELWKTDGTPEGTVLLADINPGTASSNPHGFCRRDSLVLFVADDGVTGSELWRTDGTPEGTVRVADIGAGAEGSDIESLTWVPDTLNPYLVFRPCEWFGGCELWGTDGYSVTRVRDLRPGRESSNPSFLTYFDGYVYFAADDGTHGTELWRTDGTYGGTRLVKDIDPRPPEAAPSRVGHSNPEPLLGGAGPVLYFRADDGVAGGELWKTDGTDVGTVMVADMTPGSGSTSLHSLAWFDSLTIVLGASSDTLPEGLYRSDGTEAGTTLIKGMSVTPGTIVNDRGTLYLSGSADGTGTELWKSDGTTTGTELVLDINPGGDSNPSVVAPMEHASYFVADDGSSGRELWRTLGTTAGTERIAEINPGPAGAGVGPITRSGTRLFFAADDGVSGAEPWMLEPNRLPVADAGPHRRVRPGTSVTFDGSASSDPDGDVLTFQWTDASDTVVGTSATVTLDLPAGRHTFTLTVSDGVFSATDAVVVAVTESSGAISGRVTDKHGAPLQGIMVMVLEPPEDPDLVEANVTYTAADGTYETAEIVYDADGSPVLDKDLLVKFEDPAYWYVTEFYAGVLELNPVAGTETRVREGTGGVDATLTRNSIRGRVTDQAGNPLQGIMVLATEPPGSSIRGDAAVMTAADGTYEVGPIMHDGPSLVVGRLVVKFQDPANWYVPEYYSGIREGNPCSGTETLVPLGATGIEAALTRNSVRGRVTDLAGSPLAGIQVVVTEPPDSPVHGGGWAFTATDGTYEAGPIPSDMPCQVVLSVVVKFQDPTNWYVTEYYNDIKELNPAAGTETRLPTGATGIDAALTRNSVQGRVTDKSGNPLQGIKVLALAGPDDPVQGGGWDETAMDGTFEAGPISSDSPTQVVNSVLVKFQDPTNWYVSEFYDGIKELNPAAGTETRIPPGTTGIRAALTRNSVRGRVTDKAGNPLQGIKVTAAALPGSPVQGRGVGYTAADGTYEAGPITSDSATQVVGAVVVKYEDPDGAYVSEFYDNVQEGCSAGGTATPLEPGATGIDAQLSTECDNRPPVLDPIGNGTVDEGQLLTISVTATDPDGDVLTYSASPLPAGATLNPGTGTLSWRPDYTQAGTFSLVFAVFDNRTPPLSDSEAMTITVSDVNRPPVLAPIGNRTGSEREILEFAVTATDPDGDGLTYSASNLPAGAAFEPLTQTFAWRPAYDQSGQYAVEFAVMDDGSPVGVDSELVTITVANVNRAPVFTFVGPQQVLEGQLLQFRVIASDPDGDAITYSTGPLPGGASFDAVAHLFSWTPDGSQAGRSTVTFYAKDSGSPSMQDQLDVVIDVVDVPTPCELSDQIIETVLGLHLRKSVERSYLANLKKVCGFVEAGKRRHAIAQLDAFIVKVFIGIARHDIGGADGWNLIRMAVHLKNVLMRPQPKPHHPRKPRRRVE